MTSWYDFLTSTEDMYAILQMKTGNEKMFMDYDYNVNHGKEPEFSDYDIVYIDYITAYDTLDDIYVRFNSGDRPLDFTGHSLSVSDVIVMNHFPRGPEAYYVDTVGFKKLYGFLPKPQKTYDITLSEDEIQALYLGIPWIVDRYENDVRKYSEYVTSSEDADTAYIESREKSIETLKTLRNRFKKYI